MKRIAEMFEYRGLEKCYENNIAIYLHDYFNSYHIENDQRSNQSYHLPIREINKKSLFSNSEHLHAIFHCIKHFKCLIQIYDSKFNFQSLATIL